MDIKNLFSTKSQPFQSEKKDIERFIIIIVIIANRSSILSIQTQDTHREKQR